MAPKKKGAAAAAKPEKAKKAHNLIDPSIKKQFIEMRDHWEQLDQRAKSAAGKRSQYQAEIKKAGFKMVMVKDSLRCMTPEGEADFKAEIANRLLAAAYAGAEIGDQLSLFLEPDRTPAIDRARHEGEQAAMEHKAHKPPYDSSVPQYKAWSEGFYAEQERQVLAGIKKKEDKEGKAATGKKRGRPAKPKGPNADPPAGSERTLIPKAEKDAKAAAKAPKADSQPPRTTPAVAPATRASLKAQREAAREAAESYFSKSEPAGNA